MFCIASNANKGGKKDEKNRQKLLMIGVACSISMFSVYPVLADNTGYYQENTESISFFSRSELDERSKWNGLL